MKKTIILAAGSMAALISAAHADIVHLDDVIVDGSLAVGLDSVNGENFGFDTIRLKENNLRLHFDDTSVAASFPRNDWRLVANDSNNGGANRFSIEDATANRVPFTLIAGAPSNSLYVDSAGDVGLGNNNPVVPLHITDGNTPTMRLEQDGSSGFTAQTWDLAGNEANFFIRDVTNGSKLPFRIKPGAPTSSISITAGGNVGLGTEGASNQLHLKETEDKQAALFENTNGTAAVRTVLELKNNGASGLKMSSDQAAWDVIAVDEETFTIGLSGESPTLSVSGEGGLTVLGDVVANGVTLASDRNIKDHVRAIEPFEILRKVVEMPVNEWSYKRDDHTAIRHIGPMAQDFRAQFGLGSSDKGIDVVDSAGIALAAIQGLNGVIEEKDRDIQDLRASNALLSERLEALSRKVEAIETTRHGTDQ